MRFLSALLNDIRYQIKYGFYFLYTFFSALYIAVLIVCPPEYKNAAASIIILSDPAMLGSFFIGGIWLLEKNEGLHKYWGISPLRPMEYILSKAISLALISTLAANIIAMIGLRQSINYAVLSLATFAGSMVFTALGLIIATYAGSVNHYMLLVTPLATLVTAPPILAIFGVSTPALDLTPGMALWRFINYSIGETGNIGNWLFMILLLWLGVALLLANRRIPLAMQQEGDEKI